MFETLRRKIGEFTGLIHTFDPGDYRVASAALLMHVATADGSMSPKEHQRLIELIEARYGLDAGDTRSLIAAGEDQDKKAVDLADFTEVLGRVLDLDGRKAMLEMMWDMALSDGTVHEFEEALVMRAAALLGLSPEEAWEQRERAAGTTGAT